MPRHLPALVVLLSLIDLGAGAFAQTSGGASEALVRPVALIEAGIQGVVRDEAGQAVSGVSIFAMGATLAAVRSDSRGRFLLLLAPGEYILRAAREGYLSTVREPIRVHTRPIERDITLTRVPADAEQPAGVKGETPEPDHAHSELAWRLRHMTRSVLRDGGSLPLPDDAARGGQDFAPRPSLVDWVVAGSARAATSFFSDTDFRGRVDFLTLSTVPGEPGAAPRSWPRGAAAVLVGAPVGSHGDWSVRAALAADDRSSWTLVGDYQTHPDRVHAFRLGVSYSSQASVTAKAALPSIAAPGSRRVGGAYLFDTWRARPDVTFEYGVRVDRYDYLAETGLVSPSIGARIAVLPAASVTAKASRRLIAPGASEFLPPSASGPWLPPERTFSTLLPDVPLHPEAAHRYEIGLEYAVRWPTRAVLKFGRLIESVDDQVATLFGLDAESEVGHYYVATTGSPHLEAWMAGFESELGRHARVALTYTTGQARWRDRPAGAVDLPAGAGPIAGTVQDLTVSFNGTVPETATRMTVAYRANTHLLRADRDDRPGAGGRFDVELRQELPYRPISGGTLDLVVAVRTLFNPLIDHASFYDELLTVAPPTRVVCGVQVRF